MSLNICQIWVHQNRGTLPTSKSKFELRRTSIRQLHKTYGMEMFKQFATAQENPIQRWGDGKFQLSLSAFNATITLCAEQL